MFTSLLIFISFVLMLSGITLGTIMFKRSQGATEFNLVWIYPMCLFVVGILVAYLVVMTWHTS